MMDGTDIQLFSEHDRTEVNLSSSESDGGTMRPRTARRTTRTTRTRTAAGSITQKTKVVYNDHDSDSMSVSSSGTDTAINALHFVTDFAGTAIRPSEKRTRGAGIDSMQDQNRKARAAQLMAITEPKGPPSKVVGLGVHNRKGSNKTRELARTASQGKTKNNEIKSSIYTLEQVNATLIDVIASDKALIKSLRKFFTSDSEKSLLNVSVLAITIFNKLKGINRPDMTVEEKIDTIFDVLTAVVQYASEQNLLSKSDSKSITSEIDANREGVKRDIRASLNILDNAPKRRGLISTIGRLCICCGGTDAS